MKAGVRGAGRAGGRRWISSAPWREVGLLAVLAAGVLAAPAHATTPGTNGLIAFEDLSTQPFRIETVAADGSTRSAPLVTGTHPAWSPDGTQIAYIAPGGGANQIWVMDADGSNATQITSDPAGHGADYPTWSPDGKRIAFSRAVPSFASQIAVINRDGTGETPVTQVSGTQRDLRPNWSPDGSRIAFDSTRVGNEEVWLVNPDGSGLTQLTTTPGVADGGGSVEPNFSPDGTRIAFGTNRDTLNDNSGATDEIYVMNADGTLSDRLTFDQVSDDFPSWSPDGKQIAYGHAAAGSAQLYLMNADGTNQHQILADAQKPDWQPTHPDSDGDGLPDDWETAGIDTPAGHLDLPAMGADPHHKDIFVELDAMPGDELSQSAIDDVVTAFANAPVSNPDGTTGIDLHVDNGPASIMNPVTGATWGARSGHDTIPHADMLGGPAQDGSNEYDWSAFDALRAQFFSPVREPAFHYAISAHEFDAAHHSGLSRGITASDFIIALGSICDPTVADCTEAAQAGTFMHELGHNLGLRHGGGDELNFKPNYLSIMNYAFQFTGLPRADGTTSLDYSRFALPTLDETQLNENAGFGGPAGLATLGICPDGSTRVWLLTGPVDFDCDATISATPVRANVNADCVTDADGKCIAARLGPLPGFDDWAHLDFTGGGIGLLGAPAPPTVTPDDEPPISVLIADAQAIERGPIVTTTPAPAPFAPFAPPAPAQLTPTPPAANLLVLSRLHIHPAHFQRSATVSYRLSASGQVRFTIVPCRAHCTFTRPGRAGANTLRLRNRGLSPGRHRLRARPLQTGAKTSTVSFWINAD